MVSIDELNGMIKSQPNVLEDSYETGTILIFAYKIKDKPNEDNTVIGAVQKTGQKAWHSLVRSNSDSSSGYPTFQKAVENLMKYEHEYGYVAAIVDIIEPKHTYELLERESE